MAGFIKWGSAASLAGILLLVSGNAESGIIPAGAGAADDTVNKSLCFQRDFQNPGRVKYTCQNPIGAWWDVPVPITSTGNKSFSVWIKGSSGFVGHCDALVVGASGNLVRWNEQTYTVINNWINFPALAVNANETAVVACEILQDGIGGENFMGSVKGF